MPGSFGPVALALVLAASAGVRESDEVFPELTPRQAATLIQPVVTCPDMTFEVLFVRRDEARPPSERFAFMKLSTGATAWANFMWVMGDKKAWDAWRGKGIPPGEWRLIAFLNVGTASPYDRMALDPRVQQAMTDIRTIATGVEAWGHEHGQYPEGSLQELFQIFVPRYLRRMRFVDPWGEPYLYRVTPGTRKSYFIASPGADRRYQHTAEDFDELLHDRARSMSGNYRWGPSLDTDLIMYDGMFMSFVEPAMSLPFGTSGRLELSCPPLYWPYKAP